MVHVDVARLTNRWSLRPLAAGSIARVSVDVRELSFQAHKARNAAKREGASLLIVDGQTHALDYEIGRPMTMGTLPDLDLSFSAQGVSRHHAKLHCYGRRWAVEDNSKNGTLVRRPSQPRPG